MGIDTEVKEERGLGLREKGEEGGEWWIWRGRGGGDVGW